jgi:hypothetical protein
MFFESSTTTAPTIATMSWWQELCPKCHAARRIVLYILKITSHILSWRLQIAIQEILWGPMGGLGGWPWAAPEWISFNRRARFHSKGGYGRNLDRRLKLITSGAAQEGWWSILVNTSKVQSPRYFGVKYCDGYFARRHEGQSNGQYWLHQDVHMSEEALRVSQGTTALYELRLPRLVSELRRIHIPLWVYRN